MSILELNLLLHKKNKENEKVIENLLQKLKKTEEKNVLCFREKSKNYFDVVDRTQRNQKLKLHNMFNKINANLNNIGVSFDKIFIKGAGSNKNFDLFIKESFEEKKVSKENMLFFKDRHHISDKTYRMLYLFLKVSTNVLPSLYYITNYRNQLNNSLEKFIIDINGSFVLKVRSRIYVQLCYLFENNKLDAIAISQNAIKIKLSIDQTNIGRKLKLINLTFTVISEGQKALTASGNYTLGILICKENYNDLKDLMHFVMYEISLLKTIKYNNQLYKIEYFCGSDAKILSQMLGLAGSNSNYPCIWCTVKKQNLCEVNYNYSINNPTFSRSISNQNNFLENKKGKTKENFGYKNKSLLTEIDFKNCILDTLHLFLRISDKLQELFTIELCNLDNINTKNINYNPLIHPHVTRFVDFLNNTCNFKIEPVITCNKGKIKIGRDLRGGEKIKLFEKINFPRDFPNIKNSSEVQRLWSDFFLIYTKLLRNQLNSAEMKLQSKKWFSLFSSLYDSTESTTPYIHSFVHHVHEFIEETNDINIYNVQGLEKLNDLTTTEYFRCSNKKKTYIKQILLKRLRCEYMLYFKGQNYIDIILENDKSSNYIKERCVISPGLGGDNEKSKINKKAYNYGKKIIYTKQPDKCQTLQGNQTGTSQFRELHIDKNVVLLDLSSQGQKSWLSELNIIYALQIIKKQYKHVNVSTKIYKDLINQGDNIEKSIFIYNTGNHWITYTNLTLNKTKNWIVYDSLNNFNCLIKLKEVFLKLNPNVEFVQIQTSNVIKQSGSDDCGLFAIAFVLSLCNKKNPSEMKYEQKKMRQHYNDCVNNEVFDEFPGVPFKNKNQTLINHTFFF